MSSLTVRTEMAKAIIARKFPTALVEIDRRLGTGLLNSPYNDIRVRQNGATVMVVRLNGRVFPKTKVMPRTEAQRPLATQLAVDLKKAGLANPKIEEMSREHID
ncbi:MAG: hypothetical protein Q7S22_00215 [Candidatus Micrarchaeota archaeon]|nr:hypothetical protein [Candidatus Micrarchaeota archaeon]